MNSHGMLKMWLDVTFLHEHTPMFLCHEESKCTCKLEVAVPSEQHWWQQYTLQMVWTIPQG